MDAVDKLKSAGTVVVSVLTFAFVLAWSVAVWARLGEPPTYLKDGKTVSVDEFVRAKDLFVLVLPLLTSVVGYWLGSQGTAKAEDKAAKADAKKDAVLAAAPPEVLAQARNLHPEAFE